MAPMFPSYNYEHWPIVMDKPSGQDTTKVIDATKGGRGRAEESVRQKTASCKQRTGLAQPPMQGNGIQSIL
ncbi:hypothetical protein E2562_012953 [Oryza meyeriana var. granulata]|uniref:Uncharacterized protein n=1 Tax=Oryza meyeriana var. granulata TaxID=110450 RepID=A0A6G1DHT6_9ORYZ|nr:hypothetical protein E2562_012953 [Oryza meyeriana var. granulata]